jgi:hypothetical protein
MPWKMPQKESQCSIAHLLVQLAFGKTLVVALVPDIFRRQAGSRGGGGTETTKHFATAGMDVPEKHTVWLNSCHHFDANMAKSKVYQMSPATITEVSGCWLLFEEVVPVEEEDNVSKPTRRRSISVMR